MKALSNLWNSLQSWLFPHLERELGELSERDRNFIRVVESTQLGPLLRLYKWKGFGRKSLERL